MNTAKYIKILKNGLIYASIGLFVVGVLVLHPKSIHAAVIFDLEGVQTNIDGESLVVAGISPFQDYSGDISYEVCVHSTITNGTPAIVQVNDSSGSYSLFVASSTHNMSLARECWTGIGFGFTGNANGVYATSTYRVEVALNFGGEDGGISMIAGDYVRVGSLGEDFSVLSDTQTHFISVSPTNGNTSATTSSVGSILYARAIDFPNYGRLHVHFTQDSAFACQNSGAVYDAIATCAGANSPASPIDIDFGTSTLNQIISGRYTIGENITFGGGGNWTGVYEIQQVSSPWYLLGLQHTYVTVVATTTHITIGQPSPMDEAREAINVAQAAVASSTGHGIGAILASTTAQWKDACAVSFSGFNFSDCLTLSIVPSEAALSDDLLIIEQTPPWGYVFRVIDILSTKTASTSLPTISYDFASSSPMSSIGNIHFDPFTEIANAGTLINEMHSDRPDGATVWTILMPVVKIFVYFVLIFQIIHDLTGIYSQSVSKSHKDDLNN